jgi:hypothetical protein
MCTCTKSRSHRPNLRVGAVRSPIGLSSAKGTGVEKFGSLTLASSLKSTGTQTRLGKAHSSRNAIKYGVFARLPVASMKELGK